MNAEVTAAAACVCSSEIAPIHVLPASEARIRLEIKRKWARPDLNEFVRDSWETPFRVALAPVDSRGFHQKNISLMLIRVV